MQEKYIEIKPGEAFKFGGQNWIRLEEAGLCVMEDILEERAFDEESNDWRKSELREYLNNFFYERLTDYGAEEKDFLMIETDLTADDGTKDWHKQRRNDCQNCGRNSGFTVISKADCEKLIERVTEMVEAPEEPEKEEK